MQVQVDIVAIQFLHETAQPRGSEQHTAGVAGSVA